MQNFIAVFFTAAFLCNSIPHLASGLQGMPFPTPFAKPRGIGDSSPVVNFLWGAFNLIVGLWLLAHHPLTVGINPDFIIFTVSGLVMGVFTAHHFGNVRKKGNHHAES